MDYGLEKNKLEDWTYITHPNKLYELVKNTGTMNKKRTGYFTDTESEMLTVLDYLNNGEKTNITDAMIKQVDEAIRNTSMSTINIDIDYWTMGMSTPLFAREYIDITKQNVAIIYYVDEVYTVKIYGTENRISTAYKKTLLECREYLKQFGFRVKYPKLEADTGELVEAWI